MLILVGTLVAMALVPLLRGRLSLLSGFTIRKGWLVACALGVQVLVISVVPGWPRPLLVAGHGLSYVLAGYFLWLNRRLPGLLLVSVGGGLNALAIAANGGQMPASRSAVRAAGLALSDDEFVNSGVVAHPKLAFLGDVFASPSWLPLRNVYSLGDLVILTGAVWAVHRTCRSALARDPRPWLLALLLEQQRQGRFAALAMPATDAEREVASLVRERDEALAEVRRTGERNVELRRENARLIQARGGPPVLPDQPSRPRAAARQH